MPIKIKSASGGSVTIDVPSTAVDTTMILPTNNASLVSNTNPVMTGNVSVSGSSSYLSINGNNINQYNTGMRNRIINGGMVFDQRANGSSIAAATIGNGGYYTADRWAASTTQSSKYTLQQVTDAPTGFSRSLKLTSSSAYSVVSTDYFGVMQLIEAGNLYDLDYGLSTAKSTSLSFWVKSSLTGTFGGCILNGNAGRSYLFSYTISSANTWQYVTVSNIIGDVSGTLPSTTTTVGLYVYFSCGAGSTYINTPGSWLSGTYLAPTGQTSVVGTNGATWQVTGVQFEAGPVVTPFEWRHYAQELQLCQRYYEIALQASSSYSFIGAYRSGSDYRTRWHFKVTKRISPTFALGSSASWNNPAAFGATYSSPEGIEFYYTADNYIAGSAGIVAATASAEI